MTEFAVDKTVVVRILDEEYPIAVNDDAPRLSKIADIVDTRMRDIAGNSRSQARDKIAILTALSFASELLEKTDLYGKDGVGFEGRIDDMIGRLDIALAQDN